MKILRMDNSDRSGTGPGLEEKVVSEAGLSETEAERIASKLNAARPKDQLSIYYKVVPDAYECKPAKPFFKP